MCPRWAIALVFALAIAWPAVAAAQCGCPETATCRGFLGSDFVFTAKVSAVRAPEPIDVSNGPVYDGSGPTATLTVGTVYRGIVPATVQFTGGGDCDPQFQVGQEYLVYATSIQDATTGEVQIGLDTCSRTRLLADADADMRIITSLTAGWPEGSLYGEIIPFDQIAAVLDDAPRYLITLRSNSQQYQSTTTGGPYEFTFLPPGSYDLTVSRGTDFQMRLSMRLEEQACFDAGYVRVP
jgi:hypothetical protein